MKPNLDLGALPSPKHMFSSRHERQHQQDYPVLFWALTCLNRLLGPVIDEGGWLRQLCIKNQWYFFF